MLSLVVQSGDQKYNYDFSQDEIVIGRSVRADVQLPEMSVSLAHCRLGLFAQGLIVEDLGSTNGTWINGKPIVAYKIIGVECDEKIIIGSFTLTLIKREEERRFFPSRKESTVTYARRMVQDLMLGMIGGPLEEPYLIHLGGAGRFPLAEDHEFVIGRGQEADVRFDDERMSRRHLAMNRYGGKVFARDLESKNGFLVNRQVIRSATLANGDELVVGQTHFRFVDPLAIYLTQLERNDAALEKQLDVSAMAAAIDSSTTLPAGGWLAILLLGIFSLAGIATLLL